MKTIKIISISIIIIMMTGFTIYAKDNKKTDQKNELKSMLAKYVKYPAFATKNLEEGSVFVQFTITEEGKIEINTMNYFNAELGKYVKECLGKIEINKNDISIGKIKAIKFDFKLL